MSYLLDTNVWIAHLRDNHPVISNKIIYELDSSEIKFCSVVKAELLYGAYKSVRVAYNTALLADLFAPHESLPFDDRAANIYGRIRADLESSGQSIGPNDLMIASIAMAYDLTLVTHNVQEFSRAQGLEIEDWE